MRIIAKIFFFLNFFSLSSYAIDNTKLLVYFYETEASKNQIVKTDFIYQARASWFVDEIHYAFAVKINNKVKQSGNEIVQYFDGSRVYSLNNKRLSEGKFEANELIMLPANLGPIKKFSGNFNFAINNNDNSITWPGNKKYIFKTYDKPKILKTLVKCHTAKQQTELKKQFEIMGIKYGREGLGKYNEVCKGAFEQITNYVASLNKEYVQNVAKKTNQKIVQKIFNNARYIGEIKDELPHGKGKIMYMNGVVYEGELKEGRRNGFGKLYYGCRGVGLGCGAGHKGLYIGEWQNGKKHGKGKEITDGRQFSWNILTSPHSAYYEGTYVNGFPNGEVLVVQMSGCHKYEQEGKPDLLINLYQGHLKNCKKSPFYKGEINIKDIANMKNAKNVNGIFKFTDTDRNVFEIKYKNRELVSKKLLKKSKLVLD